MVEKTQKTGSDLFIVDNSDDTWKVARYLRDWADIAHTFDIATGYFEIGALLALDGQWQKLDKLRILMGNEVTERTKKALLEGIKQGEALVLDRSIERTKETNDFLDGVPAIVDAIRAGKIQCRAYTKNKFHAKAYITHGKAAVVGSIALVGSSNFTQPGISDNVELNIQVRREVELLQEWYEKHWDEAEDITPEILRIIERHTREYSPFEVYAKAMQEFFRGHELTASEWEHSASKMYPVLDQYQKEGYHALMKIAAQYGGAFLCDGVGLGKTFVGLMVIERLIMHDRKRVALFVPKAARYDVWERDLRRYLPDIFGFGDFTNLAVFNHTDLLSGKDFPDRFRRMHEMADVVVIDEAHHFRNPGMRGETGEVLSRYRQLFNICDGKTMFMLTATPINNHLIDLQHMIELFSRLQPDYFKAAPLGIHSLPGHFRILEKELEKILLTKELSENGPDIQTNQAEAEQVLWKDDLFQALVVQRSRAYVKASQKQHGGSGAIFPKREHPRVAEYQLRKTYGQLLKYVEEAFYKNNLFALSIYYPMAYYCGPDTEKQKLAFKENRQKAVVTLIRTQFLKRFESSARAFEFSCETLMLKLLAWVTKYSKSEADKRRLERWKRQHGDLIGYVKKDQLELFGEEDKEEQDEDIITDEMLEGIEELNPDEYDLGVILNESYLDLDQIVTFLNELKKLKPSDDDKLKRLIKLLKADKDLKGQKVLIFSEYMATARYIKKQIEEAGLKDVDEVDSGSKRNRSDIIRAFAPYYNQPAQGSLFADIAKEIQILISTDVLSEGLNLQDATRLINYDLHWNPVRLMQRIGRVDRRLNPHIEEQMIADHPELKDTRGTIIYWNFLPPDELDELLRLYGIVSRKTLRISKVFGIEGKKLLRPEDDFDALKDLNHNYEGTTTDIEAMHLEYQKLLAHNPDLEDMLSGLPLRVFSGKQHINPGSRAVFFCYALPAPMALDRALENPDETKWTEEAGFTKWYLYDFTTQKITDEPREIIDLIRSTPDTPRQHIMEEKTLSEIRRTVEKHIKNTYLKQVQAPAGVKASLKAWMELT